MTPIKSRLMGGVAALVLTTVPVYAQTAAEMESNFSAAADMQVSELSGLSVIDSTGAELGQAEYIALIGQEFVLVVNADGRQVPLPLADARFENDQVVTGISANEMTNLQEVQEGEARRVAGDATMTDVIGEIERRTAATTEAQPAEEVERQTMQTAGGQFVVEQAEPKVNVTVDEPQVTVDQPAPEVVVEQPEPTITVTQSKPTVNVEQQAPIITVEQAQPTVEVNIPEPIVTITMPDPKVNVDSAEPQVSVEQPEPTVRFVRPEPKIVVRDAEPQVNVSSGQAEVDVNNANQANVEITQAEPEVNVESAGEADIQVQQDEAQVNVQAADGADIQVEQAEADVRIEEGAASEEPVAPAADLAVTGEPVEPVTEPVEETAEPVERETDRVMMADIPARDGYSVMTFDELTADDLTGTQVYDANDEMVGEISELVMNGNEIGRAVIDVGGFLGMGERPVALEMNQISVQRADGGEIRAFVEMTESELEAMPEYE
ncbi:PRC-barrel domain-containing protein [Profundibacterium mesophilum]|uniref:PRC-barrel domain containing protein n=1 Tax=Profundibacterium mesophilum KAUST100406-0324 TaxID=1037889 RepID=A0A921TCD6_9RHOB|nr:PRC-barrel domain-containing protein [Profundibacterium mesophilum]KAF0675001.1 PRC-barrel domain containing protein [Profundibacterium mesophilum KAUST100406-0324]